MRICVCVAPGRSTIRMRLPDSPGSGYVGDGGTGPFFQPPNARSRSPFSFFLSTSPVTTRMLLPGTNHVLCQGDDVVAAQRRDRLFVVDPAAHVLVAPQEVLHVQRSHRRRVLGARADARGSSLSRTVFGAPSSETPGLRRCPGGDRGMLDIFVIAAHDSSVASNVASAASVPLAASTACAIAVASRRRALDDEIRGDLGDAEARARLLRATGAHGELHRDHRQPVILDGEHGGARSRAWNASLRRAARSRAAAPAAPTAGASRSPTDRRSPSSRACRAASL